MTDGDPSDNGACKCEFAITSLIIYGLGVMIPIIENTRSEAACPWRGGFLDMVRSKGFYLGLMFFLFGIVMNFWSQSYLHRSVKHGKELPKLSDLILDHIPYWDVDYLYDVFSMVGLFILVLYIVQGNKFREVGYYLLIIGIFHGLRAVFIILTPFGNPPMFDGTESIFNGFSNYELGVYPSGHTGVSYLYYLIIDRAPYRGLQLICLLVIIGSLFLARGHYSIDVLSGVFFAYAIKSFADKHIKNWYNGQVA